MVFEQFDRIRVINLPHRKDRRSEMERELARVGLLGNPKVEFFSAHRFNDPGRFYSTGARGCYSSHLACLKEAAAAGHSLLLIEDDCDFAVNALAFQMPQECDILYGGYHVLPTGSQDPQSGDLIGSHLMGFSASVIPRLVNWLEASWKGDDPASIDGEYVRFRRAHSDVVAEFPDPQLGSQRPSRSDIGIRAVDRIVGLREAMSLARKFKQALAKSKFIR